ncbi:MAG: LPS O-antigen length regulator [Gammaproteobacteria bacterium]|nr:LPS O-antigen length regulator [Gammaproteobacteria bacterium]
MSDNFQQHQNSDDEIRLLDIFNILWKEKILILSVSSIFAFGSVFYALSLPNIYTSDVVLKVAGSNGASMSNNSQFGSIAALAGVNIGTGGGMDEKADLAKQTIRSRDFVKHVSKFDEVLPSLMALKEYDPSSQSIIFDQEVYDSSNQKWISALPSEYEVYKKFLSMVDVFIDIDTGFLAISVSHQSPYFAKYFLELIINELNNIERYRDIAEAQRSKEYLGEQLGIYKVADIRNSINALIQSQLETEMLANVRVDYLLRPLDSAYVPEKKSAPVRSMICIAITFIGFLLSVFIVLIRHYLFKN